LKGAEMLEENTIVLDYEAREKFPNLKLALLFNANLTKKVITCAYMGEFYEPSEVAYRNYVPHLLDILEKDNVIVRENNKISSKYKDIVLKKGFLTPSEVHQYYIKQTSEIFDATAMKMMDNNESNERLHRVLPIIVTVKLSQERYLEFEEEVVKLLYKLSDSHDDNGSWFNFATGGYLEGEVK